jgi:signal transduction histidine kinase
MLGAVFEHVLSNAATHTDQETATVHVSVTASTDDAIVVTVADDGVGIPAAQQAAITDSSRPSAQSIPGSGLYFVRTVLDSIGGTIDVADNEPRGTVVTITLDRLAPSS